VARSHSYGGYIRNAHLKIEGGYPYSQLSTLIASMKTPGLSLDILFPKECLMRRFSRLWVHYGIV